jgi:hypothetical protein
MVNHFLHDIDISQNARYFIDGKRTKLKTKGGTLKTIHDQVGSTTRRVTTQLEIQVELVDFPRVSANIPTNLADLQKRFGSWDYFHRKTTEYWHDDEIDMLPALLASEETPDTKWYYPVGIPAATLPKCDRSQKNIRSLALTLGLRVPPPKLALAIALSDAEIFRQVEGLFGGLVIMHQPINFTYRRSGSRGKTRQALLYTDGTGREFRTGRVDTSDYLATSDNVTYVFMKKRRSR